MKPRQKLIVIHEKSNGFNKASKELLLFFSIDQISYLENILLCPRKKNKSWMTARQDQFIPSHLLE